MRALRVFSYIHFMMYFFNKLVPRCHADIGVDGMIFVPWSVKTVSLNTIFQIFLNVMSSIIECMSDSEILCIDSFRKMIEWIIFSKCMIACKYLSKVLFTPCLYIAMITMVTSCYHMKCMTHL